MISPWTIYWIMQLDGIGRAFAFIAFLTGAALLFCLIATWLNLDLREIWEDSPTSTSFRKYDARVTGYRRASKFFATTACVAILVATFLPSSKTAAAMVLIPAIANNETVQKEADELYQLAKAGLRELVKPEKENSK